MKDSEDHWDGTHPEDVLGGFVGQEVAEWPVADEHDVAEWQVLLEETVGSGNAQSWKLTMTMPCENRNEARRRAFELAEEYEPQHPMSPQAGGCSRSASTTGWSRSRG